MGCELPKVRKFLCCLELETGGIIIGWLNAIFSAIGIVSLAAAIVLAVIAFDHEVNKETKGLKETLIIMTVIFSILIIYLCIVFYAAVQLIRGTRNRNHRQMKLYLIIMGIGVIMSFLQIFTIGLNGLGSAIVSAIIAAYFFICIYSLYESVKTP